MSALFLGLGWIVPFIQPHHQYPLTAFYNEWLAFALALIAALYLLRKQSWSEPTIPLILVAPIGLALLLHLQVAQDRVPYPEQVYVATLYLLWSALLILLAHRLVRELELGELVSIFAWFSLIGGLCAAVIGMLQHFELSTPLDYLVAPKVSDRAHGNLLQPNHYATELSLSLASVAYLYGRRRLQRATAILCCVLILPVLALSGSRSVWLYLVAFVGLAALFHSWAKNDESKSLMEFTICLTAGYVVANLVLLLPIFDATVSPATSVKRLFGSVSGNSARIQLWSEALHMFLQASLTGVGFGQFTWFHFASTPDNASTGAAGLFNHAHSIVMHLLAETGLVGTLVFSGMILHWIHRAVAAFVSLEWWWLLGGLSVLGIHSLLEYPLWYSYFLGPGSILLGLGAVGGFRIRSVVSLRLALAALMCFGVLQLANVLFTYVKFEQIVEAALKGDNLYQVGGVSEAFREIHQDAILRPYLELFIYSGVDLSPEGARSSRMLGAQVVRFAPTEQIAYRHALLLSLDNRHEAALQQLELAMRAYPDHLNDFLETLSKLSVTHQDGLQNLRQAAVARAEQIGIASHVKRTPGR